MITNPARFALLPVILLADPGPVSAKERIVSAVFKPDQAIAAVTTRHPGKAASGDLPFYATRYSKDYKLSCAGGDIKNSGYVRSTESGRLTLRQLSSDCKSYFVTIDREMS
jgi:hypothetical protein